MRNLDVTGRREISVPSGDIDLPAFLTVPSEVRGVVIFAHGSGSGRHSPRNNAVSGLLNDGSLATLLADLLTETEAADRRLVFDVELLAQRLLSCTEFVARTSATRDLPIGYFGASTGAGAALVAAAQDPDRVRAIVSRGGRPDLACDALMQVHAPTLLIVGGLDYRVIELNRMAFDQLRCEKEMVIVPGATHLFEEGGALNEVARLARDWFLRHLPMP
jgi:putative phosphoribosyl transferase